jgi:hypothetical protein
MMLISDHQFKKKNYCDDISLNANFNELQGTSTLRLSGPVHAASSSLQDLLTR